MRFFADGVIGLAISPLDGLSEAEKIVAEEPSNCWTPHFLLADHPDEPTARSIQVVEVPRKLRPDEEKFLSDEEKAELPPVPTIEVGDYVRVSGWWATKSPRGFANVDGLLVYGSLEQLKP